MANEPRSFSEVDARLELAGRQATRIASVEALKDVLDDLHLVRPGQTVCLSRGANNFVKATRHGDLWSAVTRRGGWWTLASFSAGMTTEFSARQAQEGRAAMSLWKRIARRIAAPPVEHQLSTAQVETILIEYLAEHRFSIPQSGA